MPRYRKKFLVTVLAYIVYFIWCTRNKAIWLGFVQSRQHTMHKVKTEVATRIQGLNSNDAITITKWLAKIISFSLCFLVFVLNYLCFGFFFARAYEE